MELRRRNTSTEANPTAHIQHAGLYQARLTVSDGVNSHAIAPLSISVGNRPVITTFNTTPSDGGLFRAGDVISFSATATDAEGVTLPASAYTWNIDFLHEGPRSPRYTHHRRNQRHLHDSDHRARFQRQHEISHHADGHRLQRAAIESVRDRLPDEGQSHL